MPLPSPTRDGRKEHSVAWKQQLENCEVKSPPAKAEPRQRRRSMDAVSTERPPSMTATYTDQYLQRRRSQADTTRNEQQRTASGRMERRRSSIDASVVSEPHNGKEPLDKPLSQPQPNEKLHKENGYHHSVDTTVATDPIEDIADSNEKGVRMENDGHFATIDQDESVKVTMTKKRKAPCGRATIALAFVAGVVTVTVAGGIAVCRVYPSSPAAISIRVAAEKMEEILTSLLIALQNEVQHYSKYVEQLIRTKWLTLLKTGRLKNAAHAAEMLWTEDLRLEAVVEHHLRPAVSFLLGALKLSMEWIRVQVQTAFTLIAVDLGAGELLVQARSFLTVVLLSLVEASQHGTRSSLDNVLERTGLKPDVNDVSLSSDEFLAPLETNQAAIQSIGRELTAHESRALQDVKRFEKRRLTIAFDTNAILAETRNFALESVVNVKMAALEAIERRLKQLEEKYARSFEEALKEYERTTRQVEKEGGEEMLADVEAENKAQIDAAAELARALTTDEKPAAEDRELLQDGSRDEVATADQSDVAKEDLPFEELLESTMLDSPEVGDKEEVLIVTELVKEGLMAIDLADAPAEEQSLPEALDNERVVEEEARIPFGLAEMDQRTEELSVPLEPADHVSVDQGEVIAQLTEENLVTAELDKVEAGNVEFTEVVMDLDSAVLEVEVALTELLESRNLSEADDSKREVELQQSDRLKAHISDPVDGTDLDVKVEADKLAVKGTEQEVERAFTNVRTRMATQPGIEKKNSVEEQKKATIELTQAAEHVEVHDKALSAEVEVQSMEMNAEAVLKVEQEGSEAHAVAAEEETQERDAGSVDEALHAAISNEIEALETVVAKEIEELEQLEQVLLQTEGERVRAEEELRAIAKEEESWLQSEQAASLQDAVLDQRTMSVDGNESADLKSEGPPASFSTLMQIGSLSVAFLLLAVLIAYLLTRYRKRGLPASPRRKRWQRLADLNESDVEEVVLMSDGSDEEEDTDVSASKESHMEVVQLTASVEVKAATIEASDDEIGDEEKPTETHEIVEEREELVEHEAESKASRTVVVERVQTTYTTDHPATSSSDASADDSSLTNTANISMSTPAKSKQETPKTSQRTRPRHRKTPM